MMTFTAYRWVVNEVGRIHLSTVNFRALDWEVARWVCDAEGWTELYELLGEIAAGPEQSAQADAQVEARDHEWLTTGLRRFVT